MTPHTQLWLTPGHSEEDASLIVEAEDGVYAMTHLWWRTDRTPVIDPYGSDQTLLDFHRGRVLAAADLVIPGHGGPFKTRG
jgi:glyoxylase-like metal-dependent hydrolase (beta-lactamase superfamily II)